MRFIKMLILGLTLTVSAGSVFADNDWMIDYKENWDVIIRQFYGSINHARNSEKDGVAFWDRKLDEFDRGCQDVEKRASELQYLFWDEGRYDVLAVTMYARQINDLKSGLDRHVEELGRIRVGLEDEKACNEKLRDSLSKLDRSYLSPESFSRLASCRTACDEAAKQSSELLAKFDQRLERGRALQRTINALNNSTEKRRGDIMQQVIFSRGPSLFQVLPLAQLTLRDWYGYLYDWLEIEIPDNLDFWYQFLIRSVIVGGLLIGLGIPVYRAMAAWTVFPDKDRKFRLFMLAWAVLVLAVLCFMGKMMLDLVEGTLFTQIGQFLFALAWLMLALLIRTDRRMFFRCLLLYTPLIFQHLVGAILCVMVIPSIPLTILLPLLTVPVALVTLWLLIRLDCPLVDRLFGSLTVLQATATTVLVSIGMAYVGFTIIMVWFVAMAGLQAGGALTQLVKSYIMRNPCHKIVGSMLLTLLVPGMWISIFCILIYWTAGMYNRQNLLDHILVSDFLACKQVIEISIIDIVVVVAAGFVLRFVLALIRYLAKIIFGDMAETGLFSSFMTLGTYLAWALYVIFALMRFNVHPNSIWVILGGMSLGLGFGLKEIVENFISGIILLAGRQIRPGDVIEYGGIWGKVRKVSIRATVIETTDNAVITLPNSHVLTNDFHNWTLNNPHMRRSVGVGVVYGADVPAVKKLLLAIAAEDPDVLKQPPPQVYLKELGENGLNFVLSVSVHVLNRDAVPGRLRETIERRFRERGIALSGPELKIHLDDATGIGAGTGDETEARMTP